MSDNSQADLNVLLEAIEQGIISLDDVRNSMNQRQKEKILANHPFSIWQSESDQRWRTYLPDESKPKKRKLVVKTYKSDLEQLVVDSYDLNKQDLLAKTEDSITIESLYPEWLEYKKLHTNADTYIYRITCDWKKHYLGTKIIEKPVTEITKLDMDQWAHSLIKKNDFTKKQYYNISVIMRQILTYAVDKEIILRNPLELVNIDSRRVFRKIRKKPDETEVFTKSELQGIQDLAWEDFKKPKTRKFHKLAPLAILFQMQTGLRVGELCAVRYSDIEHEDYIHIQRMSRDGYEVVDHTKTDYGDRQVLLTAEAKRVIQEAKNWQIEHGVRSDYYIFSVNDDVLSKQSINALYPRYCRRLEILPRNSHKARKTFISTLIDGQVNINTIRALVGHADEQTTLACYTFDRLPSEERKQVIETALNS